MPTPLVAPPTARAPRATRTRLALALALAALTATGALAQDAPPISLHPDNPRYFLFRGQPTVIITSGEHYGALLNLDFDYHAYFEALAADGLNSTRTFTGAYVETGANFNIANNTLDPAPERFICPWARSDTPGYADGGNKFDLMRFDEAYFERLRDFVATAGKHGIVVELNLFCPFYGDSQWEVSPLNARNNVNGLGDIDRTHVYTLDRHGGLLAVQEAMVRRIVRELRAADNVYYEICNEPYFGGVTLEWQHRIADVITDAQKDFSNRFLISRNVANGSAKVKDPHPAISILNFHYATPPTAVAENYALGRVIGDNETGFRGTADAAYRMEAWDFIVAGGGLFNHLDYSFTVAHPRGTWTDYPSTQPGGGNPTLRRQFAILRRFINGFDFVRMRPDDSVLRGGVEGGSARALVEPGKAYAIYVRRLEPTGPYSVRWTGTVTPRHGEEYTLHTVSNDGVRLWIGETKLIDNWTDHAATEDTGRTMLEAGRAYPVRLEYFYAGGQGTIRLLWSSARQAKEPIPAERLSTPGGAARGLRGEYFLDKDLRRAWRQRDDASIDFAWGTESPFGRVEDRAPVVLRLAVPAGDYRAEWVDTKTGAVTKSTSVSPSGGELPLEAPPFTDDIALRVQRE